MSLSITNEQLIWWSYDDTPKVIEINKEGLIQTTNTGLEIARGSIPWVSALNKFWLNPSVWTTEVTIWDKWWVYQWITTASILDISSTDVDDTDWWNGANTINIQWLDTNYNVITENIILDWQNIVNTTNSYLRVFRMSVLTAWATWWAEWTISANIWVTTYAQIDNWNNQTLMSIYTVPAWKTWYLTYWKAATWIWKDAIVYFKIRPEWWVFNVWHIAYLVENSYDYTFNPPLAIPEKADIVVTAKAWQASTSVSAVFDLILINN